MESKVVCVMVGILGAIAALLSFAAEAKGIMAADVPGCDFRSPILSLGVGALLTLLISQILISIETGCFTSKYAKLHINWSVAKRNSFISRTAFGIGLVLLIAAVTILGRVMVYEDDYSVTTVCHPVKPGVFAAAGILSLVSVAFGILFYLNISAGREAANTNTAPHAVYPPPQPTTGFNYDVEQHQFPTNKLYYN